MARRHLLALASVIALAAICYWPGLHGVFVFDSSQGIVENRAVHATELSFDTLSAAADSYPSGLAVHRQLTMASFALNYYFSGLDPFWFKATNLALHLANGLLVFVFAQALLRIAGRATRPSLSRNATGMALRPGRRRLAASSRQPVGGAPQLATGHAALRLLCPRGDGPVRHR